MCITVIDSLMGTGKTSWIIDVLNSELEKNFLYITPTLEETKRIEESVKNRKIYCPQNLGNGKIGNIANLLINQMDIASTHELFRRFDDKCKKALEENKYTLILDETLTAVEPYHFTGKDDYKYLLKNKDIAVNEDGLIEWIGSELDTRFDDVRILAKNKCLFKVDEKFFLWHFPHEIFTLFENVYVLTYLFNGSIMKYYFDLYDLKYVTKSIKLIDGIYKITEHYKADKSKIRERINVYSGKLNDNISKKDNMLSATWSKSAYNKNELLQLKNNFYNYCRNVLKADSKKIMWTTFKHASWILSAISALIALVPFWYIWKIIKEVLEVAPNFSNAQNLSYYGWMAVVFAIGSIVVYIGGLMCSHKAAFRVATNIRVAAVHHIAKLPLGFAESVGSGKLRKIINESSAATETYLAHQLPDKAGAITTPIGLLVLLFVFDWRLGLLSLAPVLLGFVIMTAMTGKRMAAKMKEYQNALDNMSNEAVEYVRGIPVVKTFGQTVFSFKKFKDTIDEYEKWVIAYTKDLRTPMMFYTAAVNSVFAFLIAGAMIFTQNGVTNEFLLNLLFYIIITPIISVTLTKIMFMSEDSMIVADALGRIDSVMTLEPLSKAAKPQSPKDSSVELNNVRFSYDGKNNVIKDISLRIEPGQSVAFVGPSGGGKSTLASLISRFFDVQSGSIKIGGVNVKDIAKEELMNTVSFVFQNSRLVKASILDNIKMGKPDATREEVMAALKAAQCMDIIEKFPNGVDTVIGTKGVYLSGGEQQRVAIARAVLKNAPIIILDEATAFADPDNEVKVQTAFNELAKGKTVIMIAHRLSTVANADRIYVINDGKIEESGKRDELCEKDGLFARMWKDYQASVQWKVSKEANEND